MIRVYQHSLKFTRVENILTGVSEQSKVLYSCPEFLILPDMKWDLKTISSLYLVAITQDRTIRSLRALRKHHVGLLKSIRLEAARIVQARWGLGSGSLRMYIHYQPSYCECLTFPSFGPTNSSNLERPLPRSHPECELSGRLWHGCWSSPFIG